MNEIEFVEELKKLNVTVTKNQLEKLEKYYELLVEWNNNMNLTRITIKTDVYLKHFYDSITLVKAIDLNRRLKVCDIGTGAGFPGLVLKIIFPNLEITLVDSLEKRVKFLNKLIEELNLKNIRAFHQRGEDHTREYRNYYDLITCRAVSKLNIISEICMPGVKTDGFFIPMKANIEDEIKDTNFLITLNSIIEKIITFNLPYENSIRNLLVIKKEKDILNIYPRTYDKIIKKPL